MIALPPARRTAARARFVAALEFAVRDAYDETAKAASPEASGHRERTREGVSGRPKRASRLGAGRLGEIVALCSVAAVLAGTAARSGPHAATISTPTPAAATDTATPVGAVATPAVSNQP